MNSFTQDLRFAFRMLRKRPAASAVIILTLGLGIGANSTFFSGFYAMVFRPLPFEDPERLVVLHESQPALGKNRHGVASPNLRDWMEGNQALTASGAYVHGNFNLQTDDAPERVEGAAVTESLFPLLGLRPVLGRLFRAEEDLPGGPRVVLIGHRLWTERFESDPRVVGRTLRVDDEVHEIVGVMPEGFRFFIDGQLWTPLQRDPSADRRDDRHLEVIARLRDGVSVEQAQAAMTEAARPLEELYPDTNEGWSVKVLPIRDDWLPPVTQLASAAQQALACLVLLIVCANVVNIVLAQATARQQETALRAALGAGRGRLMRQAVVESLVLAAFGGAVGLLVAAWGEAWIRSLSPVTIPYWLHFEMDLRVVVYTLLITLLTGVVIGLFPALRASGGQLFEALKTGGRAESESSGRLRRILVVAEYALAMVILVGALLMVRSYMNLQQADNGFDPGQMLTLRLSLTGRAYEDAAARSAFLEGALERLGGLAEVASAGAASLLPISSRGYQSAALEAEGRSQPRGEEPQTCYYTVSRDYLETLGVPLKSGRSFTDSEVREGGDVAVVSAGLAAQLWGGEDPLGRRLRTLRGEAGPWLRVVGVAGDVRPGQPIAGIDRQPSTQLYLPLGHDSAVLSSPTRLPAIVLKSRAAPASLVAAVRQELQRLDPSVPMFEATTMEQVFRRYYFAQHIWSRMFSTIAILALGIAAIGAYGVTAYSVSQRTREMGIRIALGARQPQLLSLVLRQGVVLVVAGVVLGLAMAIPTARLMASMIHDLSAYDPGIFGFVVATLTGVGLLASYLPARRAASVDPIIALRDD